MKDKERQLPVSNGPSPFDKKNETSVERVLRLTNEEIIAHAISDVLKRDNMKDKNFH